MIVNQRNLSTEGFKYQIKNSTFEANKAEQGGSVYLDNAKSVIF